jgi:hypothetical protein
MIVRSKWRGIGVLGLVMAGALVSGCDQKLSDVTGPSPNLQPTYASIQTEIFQTTDLAGRTACITCHTDQGRTPAGLLNLRVDPYAALVNVPSRQRPELKLIAPGDPDNSYLIHKLEGGPNIVQLRMPRNGPPFLTDGQILVIRRWIAIGAPQN